ncbi:pyridoxal 5'-phosphate synthase pdxT subunit, partial [Lecanoromycetidae sp. Uapishka_2]
MPRTLIIVGVLALQGAFIEHVKLLRQAADQIVLDSNRKWDFIEVRTPQELGRCNALIIPGGESTTIALAAARSGLLDPLRDFVKVRRKPTWGTCAGLILLAESANRTKQGGQDLIGGLDVRVNRNYFGRQTESFETRLALPFLDARNGEDGGMPFNGIFIRAPVVEKLLPVTQGEQTVEKGLEEMVIAPSRDAEGVLARKQVLRPVEIMATLPGRSRILRKQIAAAGLEDEMGDIVAVKQGNVFGTSFHPELTQDARIHIWWLEQVKEIALIEDET